MKKIIVDTLFIRLFVVILVILNLSHFLGLSIYRQYDEIHELIEHNSNPNSPSIYFWLNLRTIAAAIAAWIAARWISLPFQHFSDAAHKLGTDLNSPKLDETRGSIEIQRASIAFNQMQKQIQKQIDDKTLFLAAVSHDLRTPLTRMKLRAEKIDSEELKQEFGRDISEMSFMIEQTLDFLRNNNQHEQKQLLDIDSLIHSIAEDFRERGEDVIVIGQEARPMYAYPHALRRCIVNLTENAVKYGKSATISVEDAEDQLVVRIQDKGPGIPIDKIDNVFTPYYRVDESRNSKTGGIGLGLSIAKDIALSHQGALRLQNSTDAGLTAILEIPRNR